MEFEKNFLKEDENAIGFSACISGGKDGKTSINVYGRANPGEPLKEISIEDASEAQLCAMFEILEL